MSDINPLWVPWILASSFQHFKNKVLVGEDSNLTFIVPSQETAPDLSSDRFELIFAGPDFMPQTSNETDVRIRFNVLCTTNKNMSDYMYHYDFISKAAKFFTACIPIYKYGRNQDQSYVTSLDLQADVKITDTRPFDPVSRQQLSTIEAQYSGVLNGNI